MCGGGGGDVTVSGVDLAGQEVGQGRGGGGGQPDQGHVFAGAHGQVEVVEQTGVGVGEADLVEFHEGPAGCGGAA